MPAPFRFIIWFVVALGTTIGIDALGQLVPASAFKTYLMLGSQVICNLALGWRFGLIHFRTKPGIALSGLVTVLAFAMQLIVIGLAIIITLLSGCFDACPR